MNKAMVGGGIVILVIIIAVAAYALSGSGNNGYNTTTTITAHNTQNVTATTTQHSGTMFSSTQYAAHSYLISGNANLSSYGAAASDFTLSSTSGSNGSTAYTIAFKDTSTSYNVTVSSGDKLYYIDMFPTDDATIDHLTTDDGYAVVNSTGYIISLNYPISG